MNFPRRVIWSVLICLILAGSSFSQNKTVEPPVSIKANLMILDSKGQYSDAKPEDLKVLEDGVEQKISKLSKKDALNVGIVIDNSGSLRMPFEAANTPNGEKRSAFVRSVIEIGQN